MQLLNTLGVPNQLMAQGTNHVAIYQLGVVSVYTKDKLKAQLALQATNYKLKDVRALGISPSGEFICAQTATKTVRMTNGVQSTFDNNIGQFGISDSGQIVMVALASGAVQVITDSVTNLTVAVTDDDRVVCAAGRYMVYNRARSITALYTDLVLTPVASAKEIIYVTHDHAGKFVVFLADGTFTYNGQTKTLGMPAQGFRDAGDHILATDYKTDWCLNHYKPLAFPDNVRKATWKTPVGINQDFANMLLMVPGSGVTTATFDLKNGLAVLSTSGVASVADSPYGATGKSLSFTGLTPNLQTADNANLEFGTADFTIELFVKPVALSGQTALILQKGGDVTLKYTSYSVSIGASGSLAFNISTSGNGYISTGAFGKPEIGVWSHIAVSRTGSKYRVFLNGVLKTVLTATGTITVSSGRGLQLGHMRSADYTNGTVMYPYTGLINGLQFLNYAKYKTNFFVETQPVVPNGPVYPVEIAVVKTGTHVASSLSFAVPTFGGSTTRMLIPSTDKVRIIEQDLSVSLYTIPTGASPYPAYSMVDDSFVSLHAVGSKSFLSGDKGATFTEIAPANSYSTGHIFKFKGYIWMLYSNNVRRYALNMLSQTTMARYTTNSVQALDYWDYNDNCIVSTTSTSASGANLYVAWGDPTAFTGYAMGLNTNLQVSYVGNNVFYVRASTGAGSTGISKLIYVPVTQGIPTLLADLPLIYRGIAHLGTSIAIIDQDKLYTATVGADSITATQAQAQAYVNSIVAAIGQNTKACMFKTNYNWYTPWKGQKRLAIGTDTDYQIWQF